MEKRRPFMLMTILLLVLFTFISWLYVIKAGWRLSVGIDYTVYGMNDAYVFGLIEIVVGGIGIALNNLLLPLPLLFILVAFIFFIISGKKPKLTIATYVLLVLAFLSTMCYFFTVVGFEALASLKDMVLYIIYSVKYEGFSFYNKSHFVPESVLILNAVYGGLMMLAHSLLLLIAILPLVTLVLSFVLGRKKKKEEIVEQEVANEVVEEAK